MTAMAWVVAVIGILSFLTGLVILLAENAPVIEDESHDERRRRLAMDRRHHPVDPWLHGDVPTMDRAGQVIRMLDDVERMRIDSEHFRKGGEIARQLAFELGHGCVTMDFGAKQIVFRWSVDLGDGSKIMQTQSLARTTFSMANTDWVAGWMADNWKRSLSEQRIAETNLQETTKRG